jgi:electron-transferring-flavoprotein dehydrogenase
MLAAEAAFAALAAGRSGDELTPTPRRSGQLAARGAAPVRNFKPWFKFGACGRHADGGIDMWLCEAGGKARPGRCAQGKPTTSAAAAAEAADRYPKPDGVLTFDRLSSVFLSATPTTRRTSRRT